ncbi:MULTISPECIES: ATP-binding protein [unclassified Meridianimarinicoccus]|uniref:ATP-binding protein n=1 Tax=unclassified Meridianimarinicoccus TaxID=2923344 RepID=UPI0018670D54|nr:ATP-binding protein [Fluviibacterium sp. MJW13]
MLFAWLKHSLPRSLYGRAALILILPVFSLQLVVSIVFIQRHFEGVTRQMTRNVLAETRYLVDSVNAAPDLAAAQALVDELGPALELAVFLPAPLRDGDTRAFYDLSGRVVIETLHRRLTGVSGIDLTSNQREVQVSIDTVHGGMDLRMPRGRVSASNPHQLLVLMIATGVLMTLISFIFLRNQLRPIKRLARAADAFGKGRHVYYRPTGASEVRLAGQAFLDMRSRIERQMEQRTLMLSGVSHDLRTPLTRLKLALGMMDDTEETDAMRRDVQDMQHLVDEFLNFVRGDALDDAEATDLTELVRDCADSARRGGHAVDLYQLDETGDVTIRPMAISRALENLIGNAVRYGTMAAVTVVVREGTVCIRVEDDGPGIPEDKFKDALKPFAQLDAARNQDRGTGVGLGLAIASDIARRHGGRLHLGRSARLGGLQAELIVAR